MFSAIERIDLRWDGPYGLTELQGLNDPAKDRGLYLIYGPHPQYGADVLLYVGRATDQTFGRRIPQEGWERGEDPKGMKVYVGRIVSEAPMSISDWKRKVDLSEKLTIHANGAAYNSTHMMAVHHHDLDELRCVHVFNWGAYRSIAPETSGARWAADLKKVDALEPFHHHGP